MKKLKQGTLCVQAGYKAKNGEPIELPIIQSTTFKYDDSDEMAKLFDLEKEGYFYTRLQNPTNDAVAAKIATLEGGVGAVLTSSGQAANFYAIFNICQAGDHFITSNEIYGGTYNLFGVTLKKLGIDCTFISQEASDEEIQAAFRPNTKAVFGETISNPGCAVFDIERFAKIAHKNGVPLIVDNTFATPVNCRPFEWGADIVTHSTTKYMDGLATQVGGVVVDSGNFDWLAHAEKFPGLCTPDESYHGLTYVKAFGKMGFTTKLVAQLMRDLGSIPAPQNSFLLHLGPRIDSCSAELVPAAPRSADTPPACGTALQECAEGGGVPARQRKSSMGTLLRSEGRSLLHARTEVSAEWVLRRDSFRTEGRP